MKRDFELTLYLHDGQIQRLSAKLPHLKLMQLLHNRPTAQAQALLPSVYSICAQAQGAAAWAALSCAAGQTPDPEEHAARAAVVAIESIQETLRSLVLTVPPPFQTASLLSDFARMWRDGTGLLTTLHKALQEEGSIRVHRHNQTAVLGMWEDFCQQHVFGMSLREWLTRDTKHFSELPKTPILQWIGQIIQEAPTLGRINLTPLPLSRFCSGKLSWRTLTSGAYDVGTLRRVQQLPAMQWYLDTFGNSVAGRMIARLFDAAQTMVALTKQGDLSHWIHSYEFAGGWGLATVECARGLLVHRAQVENGRVVGYDICAPTDWNLNEDGALSTLLQLPSIPPERLHRLATWLVQSLDPCVSFNINIKEINNHA